MLSHEQDTFFLFCGIGIVLVLITITGFILKLLKGDMPAIVKLNTRIVAWWCMVIVIGIAFWLGSTAVIALFFIISFFALREFITIIPTTTSDYYALVFAFYVALPLQYILVGLNWYGMYTIFIPVYVFLLLPMFASFSGTTKNFLERTAKIQWGLMVTVYCISCVPALLTIEIDGFEGRNLLLVAFLVIVVQMSDVLQCVFGKLFGRHKIVSNLSSSITVEGFLGGIISASLMGACLFWITPFTFIEAALISFLVTLIGFMGGIVMLFIKRDCGIKDWGHMIEGYGGMLDRLDSVCFAAPIFFHVVRYWWA